MEEDARGFQTERELPMSVVSFPSFLFFDASELSSFSSRSSAIAPASFILHFQPSTISKTTYSTRLPPSSLPFNSVVASRDITLLHTHLASVLSHRQALLDFLPDTPVSRDDIDELFAPYEKEADRYREWVVRELGWEERGSWVPALGLSEKRKTTRCKEEGRRVEREKGKVVECRARTCFGVSSLLPYRLHDFRSRS